VPAFLRWPGHVPAGSVCNEIVSHLDWLPTLLAAAGEPNIKEKLLKGHNVGEKTFKIHIDGYNMMPLFLGKEKTSPRKEFFYFNDDGNLVAMRFDNWKVTFMEQRCPGTCQIWAEPFVVLRVPKIFNLRTDPYEHADITSNSYWDWMFDHLFILVPAQGKVAQFLESFKEYPPRQRASSFGVDQVMEKLKLGLECRSQ
jgi:arylsulfatase